MTSVTSVRVEVPVASNRRSAPLVYQFEQGRVDFIRGKLECPYKLDSDKGREWQRGFNSAYFDNLDRCKPATQSA